MTRLPQHYLSCLSLLTLALLAAGCAEQDTETPAYIRQTMDATIPINNASTAWGAAMLPWFEGQEVDLENVKRVQQSTVQTLQETRDRVKAIPVPHKPGSMMFNNSIKEYVDFEAEELPKMYDEIVAMAEQENPASAETIAKAQARIETLHFDEIVKAGEIKSHARHFGVKVD